MEEKNSLKADPELFKIPVELYKEDMNTELSKGKKKEMIELFTKYNQLQTKEEFEEVELRLHYSCQNGDIELIRILLSEQIEYNSLIFKIDKTNKTASMIKYSSNSHELIIPRKVIHEMNDYLVTSICSFNITYKGINLPTKIVKFEENSAVKTIYGDSFRFTEINEIYFPQSLTELKEGWCNRAYSLSKIIVSPSNDRFIFKDDKYLLGKTNPKSDEFDVLYFVSNDLKEIFIPPNVKIIEPYSFQRPMAEKIYFPDSLIELKEGWCARTYRLTKIIISPSNDKFIFKDDKYLLGKTNFNNDEFDILLFAKRDLNEISIPSSITKICSYAFSDCRDLRKVEIPMNSNLQTIEKYAFSNSGIKEISIPPSVTKICESAFYICLNLTKVSIPTNSNLQTIERNAFSSSSISEISIPPSVTKICEYAFTNCPNLTKVSIPTNSNLQTIERNAFSSSSINEISIPPCVTKICEHTFYSCHNLTKVSIPMNSNLKTIERNAFFDSDIKEISIPNSLIELEEGWCAGMCNLTKIIISPSNDKFIFKDDKYLLGKTNFNNDEFDILLFANRDLDEISIPSSVTKICECAFSDCQDLRKVEIPMNSNLQTIEKYAFSSSGIKEISIPPSVTKICECAFINCQNLTKVSIPTNSNLQTIERKAFSYSGINEISIPSSVTKIFDDVFQYCFKFKIIEISEESKLQSFSKSIFTGDHKLIIMIPVSLKKLIKRDK